MRTSTLAALAAVATLCTALTACSGPVPQPTPTPEPSFSLTGDGVLRIGTLFPAAGAEAGYSVAQVAAVEAAVREVNEAGGFNGEPVEILHRNSGDSDGNRALAAFDDLVARGVDVVIGPSSPGVAQLLEGAAREAGVALYSTAPEPAPAATQSVGEPMIVHVTAGPALQARPLIDAIAASGAATIAVVTSAGDDGGDALVLQLGVLAALGGLKLSYHGAIDESADVTTTTVAALTAAGADAVIIATGVEKPQATAQLLAELATAGIGGDMVWFAQSALADFSALLPAVQLNGAHGIVVGSRPDEAFLARVRQADPSIGDTRYSAEAYDAVMVAVLAATIAGDDGGAALARTAPVVTGDGIACSSLGACLSVLATEPAIDFSGISGSLEFSPTGTASVGTVTTVTYGENNTFSVVESDSTP